MHEVSWRRVKWPRPSWVRKDLLSVCGIVLGSIAVSRQYLLACCGGLLEASSAPLGGPLGASGRPPGADFDPLGCPGPLGSFSRLLGGSWSSLGGSKVALCRKARIRRQYSVFRGFWGLPWRLLRPFCLLRPSWRLLGGPWAVLSGSWVALGRAQWVPGGSWVALVSSLALAASPHFRMLRRLVPVNCIDID